MSGTTSGSMFADPTTMGLLGMAQGFAQAAMPSRMPVPFGAALGMGAAGMSQGAMAANQFALQQQELEAKKLQNFGMANYYRALSGAVPGASDFSQSGSSLAASPSSSSAGGSSGGSSSPQNFSGLTPIPMDDTARSAVRQLIQQRNAMMFAPNGSGLRAVGQIQQQLDNIAGPGAIVDPATGNVYQVPGSLASRKSAAYAGESGKQEAAAPYAEPIKVQQRNPDGSYSEVEIPRTEWAARNQGAGNPGNIGPSALASIQDPQMRVMAINSALRSGMPLQALPYWISAIHNESGWNQNAADGKAGEIGIGQVMPATGEELGYSPEQLRNPQANLDASAKYFAQKWAQANGDPAGALRGYNGGNPGVQAAQPYAAMALQRVQSWGAPPTAYVGMPKLTQPQEAALEVQKQQQIEHNNAEYRPVTVTVSDGNGGQREVTTNAASLPGMVGQPGATSANRGSPPAGTIVGKPIMTPEQEAESRGYGEQSASIINAGFKAPVSLQRLEVIENAAKDFRPGATAEARLAAGHAMAGVLQDMGITPPDWLVKGVAGGETIGKEGGYLAAEMTRALGSREAASVFAQIKNIQPHIEMSQGGFQVIVNSLRQGLQRDQDLATYREKWLADPSHNGSIRGMQDSFEKDYPIQAYASRVLPYPMPKSQSSALPNVIYNTARGPALWDGSKFISVASAQ